MNSPASEVRGKTVIFSDSLKRYLSLVILICLLGVSALAVTGCEDFDQWSPTQPPELEEKEEVQAPPLATITTDDRAILVVYECLLRQAESYQAKAYLANFYAACDNWSARSELSKDGTSLWYVVVDMTSIETWEERAYWQQAGWLVFRDGKVMPSNHFKANALRIEADLQELSLQPKP